MKRILPLTLFLAMSMPMFAQTTYYQNQQYTTRSGFYIHIYGAGFTASDGSTAAIDWMQVAPNYACVNQTAPNPGMGFVFYTGPDGVEQPCAPVTGTSYGPTITVPGPNNIRCSGPSSAHVDFVGGSMDFTFTYFFHQGSGRAGGGSGCFAKTLTGSVTLN